VNAENKDHGRLRRVLAHAFSDKALARQESLIRSHVDFLIALLHKEAKSTATGFVNLIPWYSSAAMDIIIDLSFGQSLGCLETTTSKEPHTWVKMIDGHVKQGLYVQAFRRLPHFISRNIFVDLTMAWMGRAWKEQFQVTQQMAQKRVQGSTEREDFSELVRYHSLYNKSGG
jgi:cytochrome P450